MYSHDRYICDIVIESLKYAVGNKALTIFAYVIMSNHVHLIVQSNIGKLSDTQVWTHENHAVYLYGPDFIREKIDYLHNNPVRSGLVEKPEDYLYSSARYYAGLDCVLEVSDIGLPWKTV